MSRLVVSESDLVAWGRAYGAALRAPAVVALSGDLGAGKTVLVRAICEGYGVGAGVTSPTFALMHRYESDRSPVFHLDLYRLRDAREAAELGLAELLNENALVLIEWPEKATGVLTGTMRRIRLEHVPQDPSLRVILEDE